MEFLTLQPVPRGSHEFTLLLDGVKFVRRILSSVEGEKALKYLLTDHIIIARQVQETEKDEKIRSFIQKLQSTSMTIILEDLCTNWDHFGMLTIFPGKPDSPFEFSHYHMKISKLRLEYMIHTTDIEARKQFMFQLCITLLGGAAQLFEEYWYHEVGEMPANCRQNVVPILECYLFGGSIGWYCQSENEIGVPYQEESDNEGIRGGKKFNPEYINAIIMGQAGALSWGHKERVVGGLIARNALIPSSIVPAPCLERRM